ncbi:MAG: hypothetical protein HY550_09190 [Elusimicrobia bacterium]|nr:hypothetical protein [Elusimicrobiota bacterium]
MEPKPLMRKLMLSFALLILAAANTFSYTVMDVSNCKVSENGPCAAIVVEDGAKLYLLDKSDRKKEGAIEVKVGDLFFVTDTDGEWVKVGLLDGRRGKMELKFLEMRFAVLNVEVKVPKASLYAKPIKTSEVLSDFPQGKVLPVEELYHSTSASDSGYWFHFSGLVEGWFNMEQVNVIYAGAILNAAEERHLRGYDQSTHEKSRRFYNILLERYRDQDFYFPRMFHGGDMHGGAAALMGIASTYVQEKKYHEAITVLESVMEKFHDAPGDGGEAGPGSYDWIARIYRDNLADKQKAEQIYRVMIDKYAAYTITGDKYHSSFDLHAQREIFDMYASDTDKVVTEAEKFIAGPYSLHLKYAAYAKLLMIYVARDDKSSVELIIAKMIKNIQFCHSGFFATEEPLGRTIGALEFAGNYFYKRGEKDRAIKLLTEYLSEADDKRIKQMLKNEISRLMGNRYPWTLPR